MKRKSIIALLLLVVLVLSACTPQKLIVGTWKSQETVLGVVTETSYTFNEDGTGTMTSVLGVEVAITYTIDEDLLTVKTDVLGVESTESYTYEFSGDQLILTNNDGSMTLTKAE